MPNYDYRCGACGLQIEARHGIHEAGPATCESCGGVMRKEISTPAILFKGSGWAKKDARAASAAKPGAGSTGAAKGADSSAGEPSAGGTGGDKPGSGAPGSGAPGSGAPGSGAPGSGAPGGPAKPGGATTKAD